MRLIDADPIIKAFEKEKASEHCYGDWYSTVCSIIRLLESRPTIRIKERKRGEWIKSGSMYYCSNCRNAPFLDFNGRYAPTNYCPTCGTDMRGAE